MQFTTLELGMMGGVCTALGAVVAGILIRLISARVFVSKQECGARHFNDSQMSSQLMAKIDDMRAGQEKYQASSELKSGVMFRMLRSMVVYMDIPQEMKEKILNQRAGDI